MNETHSVPRPVKIIRWIARICSLLILVFILMIFVGPLLFPAPDSGGKVSLAPQDMFLLSMFGVSTIGLLIAWRWELFGACLTIFAVVVQQLTFSLAKNMWDVAQLIQAAFFILPASLFLVAWGLGRQTKKA